MLEQESTEVSSFKKLHLIKPYIGRMSLGFIFMLLTVGLQLAFPQYISEFIDKAVEPKQVNWVADMSLLMLALILAYCVLNTIRYYLFESTGNRVVTDIRRRLYGSLMRQEVGFYDEQKVGELLSRMASDVEVLKDTLTMDIAVAIKALVTAIGGVVMLFFISVELAVLVLFSTPVSLLLARWLGRLARVRSRDLQQSIAGDMEFAQESVANIRLVRAFNREGECQNRYLKSTAKTLQHYNGNSKLFGVFQGLSSFITMGSILLILWYGASLILAKQISVGELTSFVLYAGMASGAIGAVTGFWGEWMRASGATERVFELINRNLQEQEQTSKSVSSVIRGEIAFENVGFRYPTRPEHKALSDFNLSIQAGETLALIGASGAGKSSVANLVLGFYGVDQGALKIDGMDVKQMDHKTLRQHMAIVEQEPSMFSGSIADNLAFACEHEVDRAQIEQACRSANAHDFISAFPDGYETILGDRGVQLSGGQKQRIAIARAILRDPKILILDEATSALDSQSEQLVQFALSKLMKGRTTLVIAHRYSTIAEADRVAVLDRGSLVQLGRHDELLEDRSNIYYQLMSKQVSALAS